MNGLRWLHSVISTFALIAGVSVAGIVVFLLHQSWSLGTTLGLVAVIAVLLEGSYRQSCKEKDALDPDWRSKYDSK